MRTFTASVSIAARLEALRTAAELAEPHEMSSLGHLAGCHLGTMCTQCIRSPDSVATLHRDGTPDSTEQLLEEFGQQARLTVRHVEHRHQASDLGVGNRVAGLLEQPVDRAFQIFLKV